MTKTEEEFTEGCPDCGRDTVTEDEMGDVCTACGWRP